MKNIDTEDLRQFIKENLKIEVFRLRDSEDGFGVALQLKNAKGLWEEFSEDRVG